MKTTTTASECKEAVCRTYLIGLGVLLPICFLQIYWTRLEFELLLDHLMNDDAFLYLQVVRNIADNGKVTFDGLHITTGIQPLWTIILVPLAVAIEDRVEFVRWVLLLSVVLNVAAGLLLARVSVALSGAQFSAGLTAALWAGYMLTGRPALQGMESGLVALTFVCLLAFIVLQPPSADPTWNWRIALAALIATVFLSRTDSVLLLAVLGAFVVVLHRQSSHAWQPALRNGALVAGISVLLVVPYLVFNLVVSGQLMPVSGSVKLWYAAQNLSSGSYFTSNAIHDAGLRVLEVVNYGASLFLPLRDLVRHTDFRVGWVGLFAGLAFLSLAAAYSLNGTARRLFLVLCVAGTLHMLAFTTFLGRFSISVWYYVPEYVAVCLFLGVILGVILERVVGVCRGVARLVAAVVVGLVVVHMGQAHRRVTTPTPGLYRARYALAQDIGVTLPPDAVIGSWNAGQLGYFSMRRVVNLDGFVNDTNYFEFLRDGGDVREYLRDEGIEYVADYNKANLLLPRSYQWDPRESFRGLWPLSDLEVVIQSGDLGLRGNNDRILVFKVPSARAIP